MLTFIVEQIMERQDDRDYDVCGKLSISKNQIYIDPLVNSSSRIRIPHLARLTFLRVKNRTKLRSN